MVLRSKVFNPRSPLNEGSAAHDVAGMTAKMHGRHLLELWYGFIKAVFMQYVNDFCRCFY